MNENVKIISSNKQLFMYHEPISNTSMPVTKFVYRIKLAHKIADFIREHTNIRREDMVCSEDSAYYLGDDDIVRFSYIAENEECNRLNRLFIENVERISNEKDEEYFITNILTRDGKYYRFPADIHQQMHYQYGLYDINKAEEDDCFDLDLEWNVAHFFIHLTILLYDAGYED